MRLQHSYFSVNIVKLLRTAILKNIYKQPFLNIAEFLMFPDINHQIFIAWKESKYEVFLVRVFLYSDWIFL